MCFNCQHITKCHPKVRPTRICSCFLPLGRVVSQRTISEWLGVSIGQVEYILQKFGANKLVELLAIRGYTVRYERTGLKQKNLRFYEMNEILREVKEMNQCALIGNLTKDPEMRQTQSGTSTCSFTLAVRRKFKNSDGEYEADFINCIAWKGTADICCKYLKKGSKCAVSGSIQTRIYDDKNGVKRFVTEIVVDNVDFLNDGDKTPSAPKETPKTAKQTSFADLEPADDEELPF